MPGTGNPISVPTDYISESSNSIASIEQSVYLRLNESGATSGANVLLQQQQALHGSIKDANGNVEPLHAEDTEPVRLYAENGDIGDLNLYSGKSTDVIAGEDIDNVAFYIQNVQATDTSLVAAGRDLIAYNPYSPARLPAATTISAPAKGSSGFGFPDARDAPPSCHCWPSTWSYPM